MTQLAVLTGFGLIIFWFTYPSVAKNLYRYYLFFNVDKWGARFPLYRDFFAKRNQPIATNMRGEGPKWVFRYFSLMMPFELVMVSVCLVLLVIDYVFIELNLKLLLELVAIFILSICPIIVAEVSRAPQMGRSYFPTYPGIILFIAYSAYQINQSPVWDPIILWVLAVAFVLFSAVRNAKKFLDDVWPARMAPAWLSKTLNQLGVSEFFTYDTPYNDAFVDSMSAADLEKYKVRYIDNINEVKKGVIVIPGTSSKSFNMESQKCAIEQGDFTSDKDLNYLIETRKISDFAIARLKTFGNSRFWGHESEVVSFRDLILKDIDENDRWRGWAWVLDAEKLHDWFNSGEYSKVRTAE